MPANAHLKFQTRISQMESIVSMFGLSLLLAMHFFGTAANSIKLKAVLTELKTDLKLMTFRQSLLWNCPPSPCKMQGHMVDFHSGESITGLPSSLGSCRSCLSQKPETCLNLKIESMTDGSLYCDKEATQSVGKNMLKSASWTVESVLLFTIIGILTV